LFKLPETKAILEDTSTDIVACIHLQVIINNNNQVFYKNVAAVAMIVTAPPFYC